MTVTPFANGIFFTFNEDSTNGRFINSTYSGIIISSQSNDQANIPRWGQVTAIGPDVKEVAVGEYILIDAGKWTQQIVVGNDRFWKTDEDNVLATSSSPSATY
jgi:co-chaperonin GroES (HSP10)